jgi:TIR domain
MAMGRAARLTRSPTDKAKRKAFGMHREDKPKSINIFVSYASEDRDLVTAIVNLLKDTFVFAPLYIYFDIEIKQGKNYAKAIDEALDEADILLVIFTDRMKMSHSYTGYEVGYFNRSIQQHPKRGAGFDRIYIPFCIGADIPDTMHYIQGVSVGSNEVYKILRTKLDGRTDPVVDEDHPVFKLLTRVSQLVVQIVSSPDADFGKGSRSIKLEKPASALYLIIHEYLQSRVSSETYPERKLIIKTAKRPEIEKGLADFEKANVEMVGDFLDIFNISATQTIGREYSWPMFCDKIPSELRSNCVTGIQQLAAKVLKGGGDNYHVVTTVKRDKSFRLFVSKVVTYVSQKTEIDVYIVEMKTKEYGDPQTSRLLKAISVGLRFRFLVLEDQSPFRPDKLGHPIILAPELKVKVSEMLGQMDLILRDAVEADLQDPDLLIMIWGKGQEKKVETMMVLWEQSKNSLYTAADEVLRLTGDSNFKQTKEDFIKALREFCSSVEEMNREYTSHVLSLLSGHVQEKIKLPDLKTDRHL